MRITSGMYRGRHLKMPTSGQVRPTQDAVREAVFSMLRDVLEDSVFVDLFAGTGAVGLEAKSRGAKKVVWIEGDARVAKVLSENVNGICGENSVGLRIVADKVQRWLKHPGLESRSVDIVYADPPYGTEESSDGLDEVLKLLVESKILKDRAIVVIEQRVGIDKTTLPEGWETIIERKYGKTRVTLLRALAS